jgi:hypothetical protein
MTQQVGYGLDFPWEACLPRIETRMYLEQYGGSHDVWIGKVLYRMNMVSNDMYLEVAKVDFSNFQRLCRLEWHDLKRYSSCSMHALISLFNHACCICIIDEFKNTTGGVTRATLKRTAWLRAAR